MVYNEASMSFDENPGYLLQHTITLLSKQSDQILQERLGIGLSQYKILMVLQETPSVKQRHIAERLGQTEASISRQIRLMHEDGLLQTIKRPDNRRENITTLTHRGDQISDEATTLLRQYQAPIFGALSNRQQRQLTDVLDLIHEQICQGNRTGRC